MKKAFVVMVCAMLLLGGQMVVQSRASSGGIGHRIHETQERLDRAVSRGSLSRYQRYRLQRSLDKIRYKYDGLKSEGLSHREREKFDDALDKLNHAIP